MGDHVQAAARHAIVSFPDDATGWFELVPGERMRVRLGAADTGGRFTLTDSIVAPGAAAPPHFHNSVDEIFFVTEGTVEFVVGDETFDASAGAIVVLPRGTVHGFINRSTTSARLLALFTPGGMEDLFVAFAGTPAEDRAALLARHDTVFVAPAGN